MSTPAPSTPAPSRRALLAGGAAAFALSSAGLSACGLAPERRRPIWAATADPVVELPLSVSFRDATDGSAHWAPEFIRLLADPEYDLLILGEVHDNPDHHRIQGWVLSMLDQLRRPKSVRGPQTGVAGLAFEMLSPADARRANAFRAGRGLPDLAAYAPLGEELNWKDSGWPAWDMYAQTLLAAPNAHVAGGAVDRKEMRAALKAGPAAWPNAAALGLDQPLDPAEAGLRARGQVKAHCDALPAEVAPRLVDAQRIRDASFAQALLSAAGEGGGFAALITGNGHARIDWGVPRFLDRLAPDKRVVSLGLLEAPAGEDPERVDIRRLAESWGGALPFDYVAIVPARARPDPCEAFRKHMKKKP